MAEICEPVSTRKCKYNLHLCFIVQKLFRKPNKYPSDSCFWFFFPAIKKDPTNPHFQAQGS